MQQSSSIPFLPPDQTLALDDSDHETEYGTPPARGGRTRQRKRRHTSAAIHAAVYMLAVLGLISLCIQAGELVSGPPAPAPDVYRPETLAPGLSLCDCGATVAQALALSCVYVPVATAWLPPYCRDDALSAEFDRSGPGPGGAWGYFADEAATRPLGLGELGRRGEAGGSFWAYLDWHVAHCAFYWQKYHRMRDTGAVLELRYDRIEHVRHCSGLLMSPPADRNFTIEVPVTMNSSLAAGRDKVPVPVHHEPPPV